MQNYNKLVLNYGKDIIKSEGMQSAKNHIQHGNVSVFKHSVSVANTCLEISKLLHIKVNTEALVRGALLHDYFLYDWHEKDKSHKWHGFIHAKRALKNAERDFELGSIEKNMIERHMFPLNIKPPSCRESVILCVADKICALKEIVF